MKTASKMKATSKMKTTSKKKMTSMIKHIKNQDNNKNDNTVVVGPQV